MIPKVRLFSISSSKVIASVILLFSRLREAPADLKVAKVVFFNHSCFLLNEFPFPLPTNRTMLY